MIRTVARRCRGGHAPVRLLLIIAAGLLPLFTFYGTLARAMGDVVFSGAGDIADCLSSGDEATASLLDTLPGHVFTLGDNAYENGTDAEYANCYEPSWGRHKARTYPSAGNHEYNTPGATGYYNYFGAAAGESGKGYYSYDLGTWHIVVLNSNCASIGGCQVGSPQEQWLQADLAAHPAACTLAYMHHPRFSSGPHGNTSDVQPLWEALYAAGADVVLASHDHLYERFAPQDPAGNADPATGLRSFVVGTGGRTLNAFATVRPNSEARHADTHGVIKMTLGAGVYSWEFVPVAGKAFADSGSDSCHDAPSGVLPTATATPSDTASRTIAVTPVADTYVSSQYPSTSFGAASSVGSDASPIEYAYMRFDTGAFTGRVSKATLRLYVTNGAGGAEGTIRRMTNTSWGENTVTYNNQPSIDGEIVGSYSNLAIGTWIETDVTSSVAGLGVYSFGLSQAGTDGVDVASREDAAATYRPQLELTVIDSTGTPTPSSVVSTPTATSTVAPATATPTQTTALPTASPTASTALPTATPSVTPASRTVSVGAVADTYVSKQYPGTNYGGDISVGSDASPVEYAYMRFNTGALPGAVVSAKLRIYATNGSPAAGATIRRMTNTSWSETGVTYNTRPAIDGVQAGSLNNVGQHTWVELDVTSIVKGSGAYSFGISQTGTDGLDFASRESSGQGPQLLIVTR